MAQQKIETEADALRDILDWSKARPHWQRDALRRLVTQAALTDVDIAELSAICIDPAQQGQPLNEGHINAQSSGAPTISLKSIGSVQNVNALAEQQTLSFLKQGVTIVYGDNGAGKSGYVRILKNACRARATKGKEEPILYNIFEEQPGPQRARLEYFAGAQEQKTEWQNGEPAIELLSEVSVFDTRTANVHVEETNDLAYTPYPMKLLERLADACKKVKAKIDSDIAELKAQTPQSIAHPKCGTETRVGQIVSKLSGSTQKDTLIELARLSEVELTRIAELSADFSQDPKVAARRLTAQKTRLESLKNSLKEMYSVIDIDSGDLLEKLASDFKEKDAAARLAAQTFANAEVLTGVGSDSWRRLWEAAREFSTGTVYIEEHFPHTGDDARCVLCQQNIDEDTASRLNRFEAFVQDRTQREQEAARQALETERARIQSRFMPRETRLREISFVAEELANPELAKIVRTFLIKAHWRVRSMLRCNSAVEVDVPGYGDLGLDAVIADLEQRAQGLLLAENNEDRKKLRAELDDLQDRQWLSVVIEDVLDETRRRGEISKLESSLNDTRPNTVTSKNTSLSQNLITDRLRARFAREIGHLNLPGLAVELIQAGSQLGVSRFKVSLIDGDSKNVGSVLSEGEYRCVALAGFLAELATNDSDSGIIFDDPVSSLDHLHREAIANRLAQEGRRRQVVVFTHDLPFLFLLRNACTQVEDPADQTPVALRHVQKRQNTPGHCRNEAPEKAQDAHARLKGMRAHLQNTSRQYEQDPDGMAWIITARGLIDSLRQTWEAAVEDAISPVLRTFTSKVSTRGFAKLSAITLEDAYTMRRHYGQCSVLLHNISDAMNPAAPSPTTISDEIDALEEWLDAIVARQKVIATN